MQGHIWYQMKAYDLRCTIWNVVKKISGAYYVKFDVEMTSSKCLKILIFWMKIYVLIICTEMWQFHLQNRNSLDLFLIYKSFSHFHSHSKTISDQNFNFNKHLLALLYFWISIWNLLCSEGFVTCFDVTSNLFVPIHHQILITCTMTKKCLSGPFWFTRSSD